MALGDLAAFFRHVASYAAEHDLTNVDFLWHGGEPFLIPIEYYSGCSARPSATCRTG